MHALMLCSRLRSCPKMGSEETQKRDTDGAEELPLLQRSAGWR